MTESAFTEPDPSAVLASVGWEGSGFERITQGWYNLIWKFMGPDAKHYALRMARPEADQEGLNAAVEREIATISALAACGLPVPAVEVRGAFDGVPFMVQRWLPGAPMLDVVGDRPWKVGLLGQRMGRLQALLHRQPTEGVHVLPENEWTRRVIPYSPDLAEAARKVVRYDAICHLDFHPLNILVRNFKVSGLVDLTNAAVADRRMDVGLTDALMSVAPIPPEPLRPVKNLLRGRFAAGWRAGYAREAGEFPLEPVFAALGAAHYLREFETAVREGRGWATEKDVAKVRAELDRRLAAAGLPPANRP